MAVISNTTIRYSLTFRKTIREADLVFFIATPEKFADSDGNILETKRVKKIIKDHFYYDEKLMKRAKLVKSVLVWVVVLVVGVAIIPLFVAGLSGYLW